MISMPENWKFSIKGLSAILPDGERKISTALKELENRGYLIRKRIYVNGKIAEWIYLFSDGGRRRTGPATRSDRNRTTH